MPKWLPYALAVVAGLVAVVLMFGPGLGEEPEEEPVAGGEGAERRVVTRAGGDEAPGGEATAETPEGEILRPAPPGTLRPMNKGESEALARRERPINKHYYHTSSSWVRLSQVLSKAGEKELAGDAGQISTFLQDQIRRGDDTLDVGATIARERDVIAKVRASGAASDAEVASILDYLDASTQAVLDGRDPSDIPKPTAK